MSDQPFVDIEVKGLIELQQKMQQIIADTRGAPVLGAMRDATLYITNAAKRNLVGYESPTVGGVDTGRLRASITPSVSIDGEDVQGVVGSNVVYAPYVEYGTKPHWPPLAALEVWAERHGTTAFMVALGISRRGTIAKKFLAKAIESSQEWIKSRFERMVQEIINK